LSQVVEEIAPGKMRQPVVFCSTLEGSAWGGSEEIWWGAANRLADQGVSVRACVEGWLPLHPKVDQLKARGIDVLARPHPVGLMRRALHKLRRTPGSPNLPLVEAWLKKNPPGLVIVNEKYIELDCALMEMLRRNAWDYVLVVHANAEEWWPQDRDLQRYEACINAARQVWFVSEGNKRLARKQFGPCIDRSAIIRNPFEVAYDAPLPFPDQPATDCLNMASVGRFDPRHKAQDLLIETLATPAWRDRNWRLNFYGSGPRQELVKRMVRDAGLMEKAVFHGHIPAKAIFRDNHALVHVSRLEGLPIVIVEAMLTGRAALVTDVAGNAEFLEEGVSGFIADAPVLKCVMPAFERLWENRGRLEEMGLAAASAVRRHVPADPVGAFVKQLAAVGAQAPGER
jgi:glycosyltransferase involved in cell wall biosynthesis